MNEKRTDRYSSLVQRAVSDIIQFKVKANHDIGFVTVTNARVTNDLSYAYIYVSILNDDNHEKFAALDKLKGYIRTELAHEVKMRKTPQIVFKIDDSIDNYLSIDKLLKESKK